MAAILICRSGLAALYGNIRADVPGFNRKAAVDGAKID
jgi:hypothetical protein